MKIRARGRLDGLKLLTVPVMYQLTEADQDDDAQGGLL
jgi:hypothetical protein